MIPATGSGWDSLRSTPMADCRVCADRPCFRHCIYCDVDCDDPDVVHHRECPSSTGAYPAVANEHCCDCGDPVGEFYALIPDDTDGFSAPVFRVVCLPCKVLAGPEKGTT